MSQVSFYPTELRKDAERRELVIQWSDGVSQRLRYRSMRDQCPCAHCIDKRMKDLQSDPKKTGMLNVLSAAETKPLDIVSMKPIGNYAYSIQFSDGHSSGIFAFNFLRSLESESGS